MKFKTLFSISFNNIKSSEAMHILNEVVGQYYVPYPIHNFVFSFCKN